MLHDAVTSGNVTLVRHLLHTGTNPNTATKDGTFPLILAECIKNENAREEIVELLVSAGADPDVGGGTPLLSAVFYGRARLVTLLLKAGADLRRNNLLHLAAEKGDDAVLEVLLGDKRSREVVDREDGVARTPAFVAALKGHKRCLRVLVEKGADLSKQDLMGDSVMDVIFENFTRPEEFFQEIFDLSVVLQKGEKKKYYVGKPVRYRDLFATMKNSRNGGCARIVKLLYTIVIYFRVW